MADIKKLNNIKQKLEGGQSDTVTLKFNLDRKELYQVFESVGKEIVSVNGDLNKKSLEKFNEIKETIKSAETWQEVKKIFDEPIIRETLIEILNVLGESSDSSKRLLEVVNEIKGLSQEINKKSILPAISDLFSTLIGYLDTLVGKVFKVKVVNEKPIDVQVIGKDGKPVLDFAPIVRGMMGGGGSSLSEDLLTEISYKLGGPHIPVAVSNEAVGRHWYVAKLASSTDADICTEADMTGTITVVGVYLGNSYTAAKEVRLYFGDSGTNHGDVFYGSLAANSGGYGINLISHPIKSPAAGYGLYLDNSANASLYVEIAYYIE